MNKKAILVIALVVAMGAMILAIRGSQQKSQFQDEITRAASNLAVENGRDVGVEISGYDFRPAIIKVKKGTNVTWTNQDSAKHTVTSNDGNFLDSEAFGKSGTYEKVFDQTGTFAYHCEPHPGMLGAVVVVD